MKLWIPSHSRKWTNKNNPFNAKFPRFALHLLQALLKTNPNERITIKQALQCRFMVGKKQRAGANQSKNFLWVKSIPTDECLTSSRNSLVPSSDIRGNIGLRNSEMNFSTKALGWRIFGDYSSSICLKVSTMSFFVYTGLPFFKCSPYYSFAIFLYVPWWVATFLLRGCQDLELSSKRLLDCFPPINYQLKEYFCEVG